MVLNLPRSTPELRRAAGGAEADCNPALCRGRLSGSAGPRAAAIPPAALCAELPERSTPPKTMQAGNKWRRRVGSAAGRRPSLSAAAAAWNEWGAGERRRYRPSQRHGEGDGGTHQQAGSMRCSWGPRRPLGVSPAPADSGTADCPSLSLSARLCRIRLSVSVRKTQLVTAHRSGTDASHWR